MADINDIEDWIVRVGLGDRKAFNALYDATSAKLFGVCLRVLNNRAEAEEALQEAFIRVWQRADRFKANGYSPMTWLITLTRNLAIDRLRARKAPNDDISERADIADQGPTPEQSVMAASDRRRIDHCLDELDDPKAGAVRGAYIMGETYEDLAARYAVPVNTMRTWLRRSLLKLRECLTR
ncbi:sigma-70 family RNA polymerase sigma factor [Phaeobacter piscinae]|uniref:sigma-70 family RNA polymerase sigma factor n=1 Tax=Phaeobacter piscinae TaxID=1580596 RepID=UPI000BBEA89F|nr:sigma-70 family RNA polymerase sigma factor [Phaeobacter piscinae]ATG41845.1 RNA polymerase sigma factor [Phaeobacter piscinae]ATG41947.1 RNA polymerase sigma factor [Phaeobacter piscinae]ATG41960.1 RNA polymerase sigma factor [Phaeobacter piscinae]